MHRNLDYTDFYIETNSVLQELGIIIIIFSIVGLFLKTTNLKVLPRYYDKYFVLIVCYLMQSIEKKM